MSLITEIKAVYGKEAIRDVLRFCLLEKFKLDGMSRIESSLLFINFRVSVCIYRSRVLEISVPIERVA
jgi:hypothetical protein